MRVGSGEIGRRAQFTNPARILDGHTKIGKIPGLSQSNIENFATRSNILVQTTLELRYGTTTDQIKSILEMIRRLLADNPRLETETSKRRSLVERIRMS